MANKNGLWYAFVILGIAAVSLLIGVGYNVSRKLGADDYQRFESVELGMSQQQVKNLLGEPTYYYEKATAPKDYYVGGYSFRKKTIEHAVMIYVGVEPIAYYYLDKAGAVEEIYIGGS